MDTGICLWMSVAVRAEARHASEMVTQLLFGETYRVLIATTEWLNIRTDDCGYEGWISTKQHTALTEEQYTQYLSMPKQLVDTPFLYLRDADTHIAFPIFIGSQFPKPQDGSFTIGSRRFTTDAVSAPSSLRHKGLSEQQDRLLSVAFQYLNAPYLWGGRTPAGIDCSGFVQMVFKQIGIDLPRDASQQVHAGQVIDFIQEAQIGDIAFFENEEGVIVHTGIVCGYQQIIHASGHVQINTLDETGIFHTGLKKYTHRLRIIKRVLL
ncbi:MAG: C40 family peptidase [Bacteroidales bacterium]|nr:C40 family peptidase [Bacteroidales bacterium]